MKPPVYLSRPRRNYARVLLRPRAVASKLTGTSNPVSFLSFFLSLLLRVAFACLYALVHARETEEESVAVLLESSFILCLTLRLICVKATFFTDKTRLDQSKHLKLESTLKLAKFSTNSPCCPFFSESPVDEGKGREGEGGREKGARKNKRVDRTCIVASADRPKSAASDGWHFAEKKLEMIDDRPILVATYGAAYPPACSRYNGRRNLFPRWPEMSRFRRHSRANFYLTTPCYVSTHADCRTYVRTHTRSFAASVYIAHAAAFLRGGGGRGTFDASIRAPWREKRPRKKNRERRAPASVYTPVKRMKRTTSETGGEEVPHSVSRSPRCFQPEPVKSRCSSSSFVRRFSSFVHLHRAKRALLWNVARDLLYFEAN